MKKTLLLFLIVSFNSLVSAQSLDPTFSGDGILTIDMGDIDYARGVVKDSDGNIYVGGYSGNDINAIDFAIAKVKPDGTLDNTFSGDGKLTIPIGSGMDQAYDIKLDLSGNIYLVGRSFISSYYNYSIVKIKPDGSLDNTFGGDGKVNIAISGTPGIGFSGDDEANCMAIDGGGNIFIGGRSGTVFSMVKIKPDGSLDNTFSDDGRVIVSIGFQSHYSYSIAVDNLGSVYLGGTYYASPSWNLAIMKFNSDGTLDASFDGDGKLVLANRSLSFMTLDQNENIVAGYSEGSVLTMIKIKKTDGSLDNTFGVNGIAEITTSGTVSSENIIMDGVGDFYIIGSTYNSHYDFTIFKIKSNGTSDLSFDGDGEMIIPVSIYSNNAYDIVSDGTGGLYAVGHTGATISTQDFAIIKLKDVNFVTSNFPNTEHNTNNLSIYPNPCNGSFTVKSNEDIEKISIIDSQGKSEIFYSNTNIHTHLQGVLILEVKSKQGIQTKTLIVE